MAVSSDTSELDDLARDLGRVPAEITPQIAAVVRKGALNVKNAWNEAFEGSTHFKGIAGSVGYETTAGSDSFEAEIGPDKERYPGVPGPGTAHPAAPMAVIAHFGGAHGGGGTVADPQTFLDDEAPALEKFLHELVDRFL